MRLTIIVTVYNREKYLNRCLLSLVHQGIAIGDYEIIVVNDGSSDGSEQIIDNLMSQFPQIRKINKKNSGVADTRNVGLQEARGNYITYVDSDDYAEEYCYSELLNTAEKLDVDILLYDSYKAYEERREYFHMLQNANEGYISARTYILSSPAPWNKLMKKDLFQTIRFPSGMFYEDFATIPLLANVAHSYYYVKKPIINYYQENDSITRNSGFQEKWKDMLRGAKNLEQLRENYYEEVEYMMYVYLLRDTCLLYLDCNHFDEINDIAAYMKKRYPHWRNNKYLKECPKKEKMIALLFANKRGKLVKLVVNLKRRVRRK